VRGIGWEYVHVAVDDASRLAYVEVLPDETGATAARFLWRALAWFRSRGVRVQRVMTDNAFAYLSRAFRGVCQVRDVRPLRTRALHPAHQRQGRTVHPHPADRVGLCPPVPLVDRTDGRPAALAALL
jgi:hypothetical protein